MNIDLTKPVWEGWTVGSFIEDLSWQIDFIMTGNAIQQPFADKKELAAWCRANQPYYKKHIPEVNKFFAAKYGLK